MKIKLFRFFAIWPAAVWLVCFALLPALLVLFVSFLARDESTFVAMCFSLKGYSTVLSSAFITVFWNSLLLAFSATFFCLLLGYPFAYGLSRCGKWKNLLLFLLILPFWTNSLVRTYALTFLLKGKGIFSQLLLVLGISNEPFSFLYTDFAVLLGMVYTLLPFMIMPIYASLEKLDYALVDAAHDLGAGSFAAFRYIIFPLTLPGVVAGCMMVFLPALGMFYIPDLLGGGQNPVVGNFIKNQFLIARNWPAGAAASVLLTLLMLGMLLYYKYTASRTRLKNADFSKEAMQ